MASSLSIAAPRVRQGAARTTVFAAGAAATGALLACGLRIVLAATVDPTYLVPSGRRSGYPAWMRGPLHGSWSPLHLHSFIALMAAMTVAWLALVLLARGLPSWFVAGSVAAATLVFTLAPPLLSTDVFNYIAYGMMGTSGINPYLHGPALLANQPVYGYTGHLWKDTPSAYGPLFTVATYLLAPLGVAGAFWVLKGLTAAALLTTAGFVWATARRLGHDPRPAVVLLALNPLVLVYALGGAHNDVLMAAPLAAAAWFVVAKRPAAAGAAVVTAIAIKASAGLALPFVLLGARPRRTAVAGALAAAVFAVAVSLALFGPAIGNMAGALAMQQRFKWIVVSIPSFVGYYAHLGEPGQLARTVLTAVAATVVVVLIARARGGRGWIEGAAAAMLIVLATTAWVLPWYVVWALPFAALVRGPAIPVAAIALTALLMAMQLDHFLLTHGSHHRRSHVVHARIHERSRTRHALRSASQQGHAIRVM